MYSQSTRCQTILGTGTAEAIQSTDYMRNHLAAEHGIDTSGMSRSQLQIVHHNSHNYGDDMALGTATYSSKSSGTTSSCPDGNARFRVRQVVAAAVAQPALVAVAVHVHTARLRFLQEITNES